MDETTSAESERKNKVVMVPTIMVGFHYILCGLCAFLGAGSLLTLALPGLVLLALVPVFWKTAKCMKKGIVVDYDKRTLFIPCHSGTYDSGFDLKRWMHEFMNGIEIPFDSIKSVQGDDYVESRFDSDGKLRNDLNRRICIFTDFGSVAVGFKSSNDWFRILITFQKDVITKLFIIASEIAENPQGVKM